MTDPKNPSLGSILEAVRCKGRDRSMMGGIGMETWEAHAEIVKALEEAKDELYRHKDCWNCIVISNSLNQFLSRGAKE